MPLFLNRMPFPATASEIVVRGERVRLHADQIIIWVSLTLRGITNPNPSTSPFLAILDTGHNHSFSLSERHLTDRAGLRLDRMETRAAIRERNQRIALRLATIWVHPNANGKREPLAEGLPLPLKAKVGIAVYPSGDFPRLPILGLRAIAENDLMLKVDGARREATLRTGGRWWPFS